jgi:hypothetical protein
VSDE